MTRTKWFLIVALVTITAVVYFTARRTPVDFTSEVKPIINKNCIACHGGVRQKAGFSLLFREEALANTKSGRPAIIPGDPDNSELIRRITLNDPEERMPYKHEPLDPHAIDILRRWIKEGANWGDHWAYMPLKDVPVPGQKSLLGSLGSTDQWANSPVDKFVEQKLKEEGLEPSPEAPKETLLRRVSLDIIGMPAPKHLAEAFLNDDGDDAYGTLVDSLMASPHFGEKWAGMWMDLARYADTKGYEADRGRSIWRYRDWLIRAYNNDKPYDQFLTEQLAGDLLPATTDTERIATAFHRNTMTNDEGGTDNEEFRISAVIDRVNTTWSALMGTTFSCVQCHSHPYDPFKHDEYYKFYAFFNNTRDEDTGDEYPVLRHYSDTAQLSKVTQWIRTNASAKDSAENISFLKTWQPAIYAAHCDSFVNSEHSGGWWLDFRKDAICRLKDVDLTGRDHLYFRYVGFVGGGIWKIHIDSPDGTVIATIPLDKTKAKWLQMTEADITPIDGRHNLYFTYVNNNLKTPVQTGAFVEWFAFVSGFPGELQPGYSAMKETYWKLLTAEVQSTPIMVENTDALRRKTYVFERGNWMVKGNQVEPDVPHVLNPFPADAPRNRLGLALWMTSPQNPLTSRTMVNRVWEQLFGTGLAETLEDLGSQGIQPTHQDLLDWLSYDFMTTSRWSVKKLIRTIVMSATYRQDSRVNEKHLQQDPYNKLYARGPRVRLSAEQIRDQALSICGVLSPKMYGPSVFPYQPQGVWVTPYNDAQWKQSKGEDQYRRALYTFWKRSGTYPSMIAFDGVSREVCSIRRIRTNTPLQALTTLNDSAYVDMARHFTSRMESEGGSDVRKQIAKGFEIATLHPIDQRSLDALNDLYSVALNRFKGNRKSIAGMTGNEKAKPETAALTTVANAILNLDELMTKN